MDDIKFDSYSLEEKTKIINQSVIESHSRLGYVYFAKLYVVIVAFLLTVTCTGLIFGGK